MITSLLLVLAVYAIVCYLIMGTIIVDQWRYWGFARVNHWGTPVVFTCAPFITPFMVGVLMSEQLDEDRT